MFLHLLEHVFASTTNDAARASHPGLIGPNQNRAPRPTCGRLWFLPILIRGPALLPHVRTAHSRPRFEDPHVFVLLKVALTRGSVIKTGTPPLCVYLCGILLLRFVLSFKRGVGLRGVSLKWGRQYVPVLAVRNSDREVIHAFVLEPRLDVRHPR